MKMKQLLAILLALVMLTAFCACSDTPAETEESPVAVQLGNRVITLAELEARYAYMLDMYVSYGYAEPTTSRGIEMLQDEVIIDLLNGLMPLHQADLVGLGELTAEQEADVRKNVDGQIESLINIYIQRARREGTTATRKAAIRMLEETLSEAGMNMTWDEYTQYLYEQLCKDRIVSLLKDEVTQDVSVSEDEIDAYYAENLALQQKEYTASPAACVKALNFFDKSGSNPVFYVPEGIVRIRVLTVNGINMKAQRTIDEAYDALSAGEDFASVLLAYGEESDYTKYPAFASHGIAFLPGGEDDAYPEAVYEAVKTLSAGEFTKPIVLEDTCVIVNVAGAEESGVRSIEQTHDAIRSTVLAADRDAFWTDKKAEWMSDLSAVVYYEDVFRGVGK